MKKTLFSLFVLFLIFIAGCQTKEIKKDITDTASVERTGDAAVDSISSGIDDVTATDNDLSIEELGDLDNGLSDIQDI